MPGWPDATGVCTHLSEGKQRADHVEHLWGLPPILKSCALLREQPQSTIAGIALDVGFYDQAAFGHAFVQQVGMTPSTFRALPSVHVEKEFG